MSMTKLNKEDFACIIQNIQGSQKKMSDRWIRSMYGASITTITSCWNLCNFLDDKTKPWHLLYVFSFLNTYKTEDILAGYFNVTRKTFRKWLWKTLIVIASLESKLVSRCFKTLYVFMSNL